MIHQYRHCCTQVLLIVCGLYMNCKWLEYLQSSFAGHQTVYKAAYSRGGSDHLFAKGRRLLVR